MHDLPEYMTRQQSGASPRSGAELEAFGKYASGKWLKGEHRTLGDAVVDVVKHAGLSYMPYGV